MKEDMLSQVLPKEWMEALASQAGRDRLRKVMEAKKDDPGAGGSFSRMMLKRLDRLDEMNAKGSA